VTSRPALPAASAVTSRPALPAASVVTSSPVEPGAEVCPHLTDTVDGPTGAPPPRSAPRPRAEVVVAGYRTVGAPLPLAGAAPPWVRPYVLTGGRTHAHHHLLVHTLVSVPDYNPSLAVQLPPEARSLYERAHSHTESVAELSAHCGIPLGVTRVLLSDLAAASHVLVGPNSYPSPYDSALLERILDGLQQFV